MCFFLFILSIFVPGPALADIFVNGPANNTALKEFVDDDRAGYYVHSPGLDQRPVGKSVSGRDSFSSGTLARDKDLYDLQGSFQKEFDASFSDPGTFDKYRSSRNSLLLLEYSSPSLADVIKHYRVMSLQRLALEQQRLADIEKASETSLDRLRMVSERECLREKQGMGLVKAMEECKRSSQPFDAITQLNGQGSLADGRRNIHVVRDAVAMLGLAEKTAGEKTAALSGDVIITDSDYTEVLAKDTFESRLEYYRQKYAKFWQDALEGTASASSVRSGFGSVVQILPEISLPGVPVTEMFLKSLTLLEDPSRSLAVAKLSAYRAKAQTRQEYSDALVYLENAWRLPQMPAEFRAILQARMDFLKAVIARSGADSVDSDGYQAMLAGILQDADAARAALLNNQQRVADNTFAKRQLMLSF